MLECPPGVSTTSGPPRDVAAPSQQRVREKLLERFVAAGPLGRAEKNRGPL